MPRPHTVCTVRSTDLLTELQKQLSTSSLFARIRIGAPSFRALHLSIEKCKDVIAPGLGCCRAKAPVSVLVSAAESGIDVRPEILSVPVRFFSQNTCWLSTVIVLSLQQKYRRLCLIHSPAQPIWQLRVSVPRHCARRKRNQRTR